MIGTSVMEDISLIFTNYFQFILTRDLSWILLQEEGSCFVKIYIVKI